MQEDAKSNQGSVAASRRCVVWVPCGDVAPADLLSGLSRRGVSLTIVTEPARVMVELARQATGSLIVVEPGSQPCLCELIRAVKTYYPTTVRWCYQSRPAPGQRQLCKLNGQVGAAADPTPLQESQPIEAKPQADEPSQGSPLGRVHRSPNERIRSLVVKVEAPDGLGEPLISGEELAMLLGPAPDDEGAET